MVISRTNARFGEGFAAITAGMQGFLLQWRLTGRLADGVAVCGENANADHHRRQMMQR
ncbi:MAG: hypothetical protein ABII09_03935 [Planctomycetota bacterium]